MSEDRKISSSEKSVIRITDVINKKRDDKALTDDEIEFFVEGLVNGSIQDAQLGQSLYIVMADDFNEKELSADVKSLQGTNATASHVKALHCRIELSMHRANGQSLYIVMADDFNEKELSADVKSLQGTNATASHVKVNATATKRGRKQKKVKNKQIESRTVNELKIMVERKRNQKKKNVITEKSVNNITNTDKNKMQRMSLKRKYPVELEQAETKEIKKKIKVSLEELETKNEKGFEKSKMLRGSLNRKCTTKMTKIETINTVEETTKKDTIQEKNNMDDIEKNKIKEVIQNENEAIEVEDVFKGKRKNVKTIQQTNTNDCKDIDEKSAHDSSDCLEEKEPDQESEKAYSGMYQTKQTILNAEKEKFL